MSHTENTSSIDQAAITARALASAKGKIKAETPLSSSDKTPFSLKEARKEFLELTIGRNERNACKAFLALPNGLSSFTKSEFELFHFLGANSLGPRDTTVLADILPHLSSGARADREFYLLQEIPRANPLAFALRNENLLAAERLLKAGADPLQCAMHFSGKDEEYHWPHKVDWNDPWAKGKWISATALCVQCHLHWPLAWALANTARPESDDELWQRFHDSQGTELVAQALLAGGVKLSPVGAGFVALRACKELHDRQDDHEALSLAKMAIEAGGAQLPPKAAAALWRDYAFAQDKPERMVEMLEAGIPIGSPNLLHFTKEDRPLVAEKNVPIATSSLPWFAMVKKAVQCFDFIEAHMPEVFEAAKQPSLRSKNVILTIHEEEWLARAHKLHADFSVKDKNDFDILSRYLAKGYLSKSFLMSLFSKAPELLSSKRTYKTNKYSNETKQQGGAIDAMSVFFGLEKASSIHAEAERKTLRKDFEGKKSKPKTKNGPGLRI